jgi:hypothetical protein
MVSRWGLLQRTRISSGIDAGPRDPVWEDDEDVEDEQTEKKQ